MRKYALQLVGADRDVWIGYVLEDRPEEDLELIRDANGRLAHAGTLQGLAELPAVQKYSGGWDEDPSHHGVSRTNIAPKVPRAGAPLSTPCAHQVWAAWSVFDDVARAVGEPFRFEGATARSLFDKLFAGMNLEVIKGFEADFHPRLTKKERRKLIRILRRGRSILMAALMPEVGTGSQDEVSPLFADDGVAGV